MLTITAVIRAKKGHEDTVRRALLEVAENVRSNEPNTIGFFVSQDQTNPSVFTTYERFLDQAAMDAHNNSQVVARFFGIAKPISTAMSFWSLAPRFPPRPDRQRQQEILMTAPKGSRTATCPYFETNCRQELD